MSDTNNTLVYVVEDSVSSGALYCSYLEQAGYKTQHFVDGYSAITAIKETMPDVILQDVCLPDISGLDVLAYVNNQPAPAKIVVITSNSSIDVAVSAMRLGGFDFLEKPFTRDKMLTSIESARKQQDFKTPTKATVTKPNTPSSASASQVAQYFVGSSLPMTTVFRLLDSAAQSKASVFITGESGTGKEVCAMALHKAGARTNKPFIALNCAAIPADLFESEFFGHVKGAFSGALQERKGAAENADGGTLFLDEICEMSLNLQSKLLRFLQTGTFSPVGSSKVIQSDVRVVCATNRNPVEEVNTGHFREDLFYRMNVIPVKLPPLRERGDDIQLLANFFLDLKAKENNKDFTDIDPQVRRIFEKHDWPGNVRELQNVIENIVVINQGELVTESMLPKDFNQRKALTTPNSLAQTASETPPVSQTGNGSPVTTIIPLEQVEKNAIEHAISRCEGNIPVAAAHLGVSASTIYRKIKSWQTT